LKKTSIGSKRGLAAAAILVTLGISAAVLLRFREPALEAIITGGEGPPTLVLLHGYGSSAEEWEPFTKTIMLPATGRFVFPKGPSTGGLEKGRAWWNLDLSSSVRPGVDGANLSTQKLAGIKTAARLVGNLLDTLKGPVILGGFSQGAMVSAEIAFQSDRPLTALILLSGTTVDEAAWIARARSRRALPVFISHGRADEVLPFTIADRFRTKLQSAGLAVTWVPFDGDHEIPAEVVVALNEFLRRLATGS
jgi:phospholipase/carboxylesterase